ncbi:MAG: oxygenase MpaB family protein [Cytophagales bacterium]|nr:DUF2236 domain-containing protein [Bernardetiaceae bacterium]MDW8205538.1 oxygenase MpaB family protein [Cytophagales bacterium]
MLTTAHFNHTIDERLDAMRQTGDAPADSLVALLFEDNPSESLSLLYRWAESDQTELPLMLYPEHPFWIHYQLLPDWVNPRLLDVGRQFFHQYADEIMLLLGFLSLPYCYAAADGAKVLFRSQRIIQDTRRRLAETAQFVLAMHHEDAFDIFKPAMPRAMRMMITVRLMHAAVRYHIRRLGKWNYSLLGVPVNQEDMAGTNMAFSFIILKGLRKIGYALAHQQAHAYLHLWNLVGHFIGVQEQLLPADERTAALLDQAIVRRQFKASPEGRALTQALIATMEENATNLPLMPFKGWVPAYMRFLLGDFVANLLAIPHSTLSPSIFHLYKLRGQLRSLSSPNTATNFGALLQRLYGKLTYRLPERM